VKSLSIQQLAPGSAIASVYVHQDSRWPDAGRHDHAEEDAMTSTQTATPIKTTTWQVDAAHTHVEFAVKHLMIATVRGRFSDVTGAVIVAGDDFSRAQIEATVGVASIDTHEPQRDAHLKSPDFFDVEIYPTMRFKSRRVEPQPHDANHYLLIGDLSLHGVTKEIVLDTTLEGMGTDPFGNNRAGFSATGKINRKDFGLGWNQLLETGGVVVGEEVKISIDAEIVASGR
jgi:polyisoprenoid-binding protein YceI